jgi:uncharacterized protein (UPF0276 family)
MTGLSRFPVEGAGLGLRRGLMEPLAELQPGLVSFLEVTPENWIGVGGRWGRQLRAFTERFPCVSHGLSLSLGGPDPLDHALLKDIRGFLNDHGILAYSEHLSYCSAGGHLYDLMPIPFTGEAVHWTAARIREAQDILGQRIAVENVSYYAAPSPDMTELEFINAIVSEADCDLLLDVNNIVVNSINHGYDAQTFLQGLPLERVSWCHIAGHYVEAEDLRIDTHGAAVCEQAWQLLADTYKAGGVFPTLLERDFNYPDTQELLDEVEIIRRLQQAAPPVRQRTAHVA